MSRKFIFTPTNILKTERSTGVGFMKFISVFQSTKEGEIPNMGISTIIDFIRYAEGCTDEEAIEIFSQLEEEGLGFEDMFELVMEALAEAKFLGNQGLKKVALQSQGIVKV